ncbi:MAG TPA: MFS transporter, partial [Homoserinimonas sp.]|nr:MFS transporter [Homoserinimonas sp.]
TLGRGVFLALTVLYFTLIVGLSAFEVAVILTVSSAAGAVASVVAGHLADRFSARRLMVAFEFIAGCALISYVVADNFSVALAIACVYSGFHQAASSVRSAIIARAFDGAGRVNARAVLHTVTNIGIAIGSAAAAGALLAGTAEAFHTTMIIAGAVIVASVIPLLRLPQRVNAPVRTAPVDGVEEGRGISPYRDRRYLSLTVLTGIFCLHFGLAEIGLPLWILHSTDAPIAMVSVVLILNTIIVIAFQIPLSRGTNDIRHAGKVIAISGVLMAAACFVYAASGLVSLWFAIAFLVIATLAHTFAEVLSSAGVWGLSFELADQRRAGAYQGVFGLSWSISAMVSPLVVTLAVTNGMLGWAALAVVFLLSAFGVWWIARRASVPSSLEL